MWKKTHVKERGASVLEYAALIVLAGALVGGIYAAGLFTTVPAQIEAAVCSLFSPDAECGDAAPVAADTGDGGPVVPEPQFQFVEAPLPEDDDAGDGTAPAPYVATADGGDEPPAVRGGRTTEPTDPDDAPCED
ncbi:hypothetical protein [Allonocardiopsis opalescens]|nr:hypothetical protein [Allonocardiopsis opalescens]